MGEKHALALWRESIGYLERHASVPSLETLLAEERTHSHEYGGRSVFGDEPQPSATFALRSRAL